MHVWQAALKMIFRPLCDLLPHEQSAPSCNQWDALKTTECNFLHQVVSKIPKEPIKEFKAAKGEFLGEKGQIQKEIF